jgi:hypothetical protein
MTTITIYKAPQKGKGQKLLMEGFQAADFPDYPPYLDGCCYFAGANDRSIAEEFNQSYSRCTSQTVLHADGICCIKKGFWRWQSTQQSTSSRLERWSIVMMKKTIGSGLRSLCLNICFRH